MSTRIKIIEENLNVTLPKAYKEFIDNIGIISDERGEVFGYIENIDINKIPCVIGATKLYKKEYQNVSAKDIVISFDDFKNVPIILDTVEGSVYSVDFNNKTQISSNFTEWLNKKIEDYEASSL